MGEDAEYIHYVAAYTTIEAIKIFCDAHSIPFDSMYSTDEIVMIPKDQWESLIFVDESGNKTTAAEEMKGKIHAFAI